MKERKQQAINDLLTNAAKDEAREREIHSAILEPIKAKRDKAICFQLRDPELTQRPLA